MMAWDKQDPEGDSFGGGPEEGEREFQDDFETGSEELDGASTSKRSDAVSLDYLRSFSLGPAEIQDPSEGVFDFVWYVRVNNDEGEVFLSREDDTGNAWGPESLRLSFDETAGIIREVDLGFNQNADPVIVAERPTGTDGAPELWIHFFDPTQSTTVFDSLGVGRTPRVILDAPRQSQRSDVLVFYFNDQTDRLQYRQQNDRYQTEFDTPLTGVSELSIQELVKAVDSRLHVVYSDHDPSSGTYSLDRLVSVLYPVLAQIEAFQPSHQVISAVLAEVIIRAENQPAEAFQPTHEIVSAVLEDLVTALQDQPPEAFQPVHEIIAATLEDVTVVVDNQPVEAYQPTHEVLTATLEEVIIRLLDQPIEAFQPTHEIVAVDLGAPFAGPEDLSPVVWLRSDDTDESLGVSVPDLPAHGSTPNATVSSFGSQPTLEDGLALNGIPYLDWGGGAGGFEVGMTDMPVGATPFSFAHVYRVPAGAAFRFSYGDVNAHHGVRINDNGDRLLYRYWNDDHQMSYPVADFSHDKWAYLIHRHDEGTDEVHILVKVEGEAVQTETTPLGQGDMDWQANNHPLGDGGFGAGGHAVQWYEYIGAPVFWTAEDRDNLRDYFEDRYGIAAA